MALNPNEFLTPVGRLVAGSLYAARTKDSTGKPLVTKYGVNAGQPRVEYFVALAIPKNPGETHWAQTPWGAIIWAVGNAAFPNGAGQRPDFSWKIKDGDSAIPGKSMDATKPGRAPRDIEGYPGHWVLHISSGYQPKVVSADGTQAITEPDALKTGYYAQLFCRVEGNASTQTAGVYLNPIAFSLAGYGPEISTGVDVSAAGFGQGIALPPGASAVPTAAMGAPHAPAAPVAYAPPAAPVAYAPPGLPTPVAPAAYAPPAAPVPVAMPPVPVMPNAGPLAAAGVPQTPPVPAAPVGHPNNAKLTPKCQGATYEQMIQAGWTDAVMIQQGMMLPY